MRTSALPAPLSRRKPCISSANDCGISSTQRVAYHHHVVLYLSPGFRLWRICAPSVSLRLGHARVLTSHCDAIHYACATSLPDKRVCRPSGGVCGPTCLHSKHLFRRGLPRQNTKDTMRCRGSWVFAFGEYTRPLRLTSKLVDLRGAYADQHACYASICSEGATPVKTQRTPCGVLCVLAGVAGFGPTNAGVKVLCLTAWLYPFEINIRIITQISDNVKSKSRKSVNFSFLSFSRKQGIRS